MTQVNTGYAVIGATAVSEKTGTSTTGTKHLDQKIGYNMGQNITANPYPETQEV
jgi:hypothetical protein